MYKNKKHTSSYNTSTYQHGGFSSILFKVLSLFQPNYPNATTFENNLNSHLERGSLPCFDPDYL